MREKVLHYIREHALLQPGDRVGVAVSGGADSVALLRLLLELRAELGILLSVVHFHHQIRGAEADADQQFVAALAREHGLELYAASGDAPALAQSRGLSLETAARELRYGYFHRLLSEGAATKVATGHTSDDQAETVLLRLLRGAGTRGLAGIYPVQRGLAARSAAVPAAVSMGATPEAAIVRPMLAVRRTEVEEYLRGLGQAWRDDASNRDLRHARNRVRHQLLPLLERDFNPAVVAVLSDLAEIARGEEEHWQQEVGRTLPLLFDPAAGALKLEQLAWHPLALRRRLVRAAGEALGLRLDALHVNHLLRLSFPSKTAEARAGKSCELPGGWTATRTSRELRLARKDPTSKKEKGAVGYEYRLSIPGEVEVAEIGCVMRAVLQPVAGRDWEYNRTRFLDPRALPRELVVRNWRAGDRFWPAHTKSPKKVKALLQQRRVGPAERALWPVVASGETIVWMRGFPAAAQFLPPADSPQAVAIEEVALEQHRRATAASRAAKSSD